MSYIEFDKQQLINLEYSLNREILRSNRAGSYACLTIICCNTRKYHGLLVCPMDDLDGGKHVLLSALDETVIQRGKVFNLGIHRYPGIYDPRGHKYIKDYETEPIPGIIYRVGGVHLKKEMLLAEEEERILIRYTLLDAHSPTVLRFKPFLAFRNIHNLSKANMDADFRYYTINNGIRLKLYEGYKYLHIQFSKKNEYIPVPHWYYNIEYLEEMKRGYECREDLYVPGYFEIPIKKGESIVFTAGLQETPPAGLKRRFLQELEKRIPRSCFENCLINSAQQFVIKKGKVTEITAGFPWYGRWSRDTFIALPGLTLAIGDVKTCKSVLDTISAELKDGLFPNAGKGFHASYNSADAPLWYVWAIQQYTGYCGQVKKVWKEYGPKIKKILTSYREGTHFNIHLLENGLIYAGEPGIPLTWMDAVIGGKPVTQRAGCPVEINALWYNALKFSLEMADKTGDARFVNEWKKLPERTASSFTLSFWDDQGKYLADYTDGEFKDRSVRPNQIFAVSLDYSPLNEDMKKAVLDKVEQELLTPKGLRTLSPKNPQYKGVYEGNQFERDLACHQGSVWPWLLGHFAEAYLKLHGKSGISFVENLYLNFEEDMTTHCVGTIPELYDGDPPHRPNGAISKAWSVAELLRMKKLIEYYKSLKMLETSFV